MIRLARSYAVWFQRSLRQSLYQFTKPKVINHNGVKLSIGDHISDYHAAHIFSGDYERGEVKIIRKVLEPDDVVMELGTGLGFISLVCAKRIGADRVHTFEANPRMEKHIRHNYELNGLHPHLHICMLGAEAGEVEFYSHREFFRSSAVHWDETAELTRTVVEPLNDAIHEIDPSFLIIDIEGGEYDLFRILADFHHIRKVAIELHPEIIGPEKIDFVKQRLIDAGFSIDPRLTRRQQLYASRTLGRPEVPPSD